MAPDRGSDSLPSEGTPPASRWDDVDDHDSADMPLSLREDESAALLGQEGTAVAAATADDQNERPGQPTASMAGHSFTIRGVLAGLVVGLIICFSNMYFGLQTGWVSSMTMPASLLGFGIFRMLSRHLTFPFSPAENVLVQTVAGSMAVMPLGCGFVGVVPAMEYLLTPGEGGPLKLKLGQLVIWSLGLCYFGVVFAVPLRRQVIIRERLRFPSGFSTAVLIGVLHGHPVSPVEDVGMQVSSQTLPEQRQVQFEPSSADLADSRDETKRTLEWKSNVRRLLLCFLVSGLLTLTTYFIPTLRNLPIFGSVAAEAWLWTLNPSLAYVGQGIIMGPTTTLHMLLGAIVGWGILSPLAKYKGWAPGSIDDWNQGSQGWIVWVSLAIMLADAVVSLAYIAYRSLMRHLLPVLPAGAPEKLWQKLSGAIPIARPDSSGLEGRSHASGLRRSSSSHSLVGRSTIGSGGSGSASRYKREEMEEVDAPADQLIGNRTVVIGLVLSIVFCVLCTHLVFGHLVPLFANVAAVFLALLLSIMGVRALGETDLNPVSGISKLAQLFFALITPQHSKSSVLINLVAGAVVCPTPFLPSSTLPYSCVRTVCANLFLYTWQSEAVCLVALLLS
jgi:OPT family oligopeptide transporter